MVASVFDLFKIGVGPSSSHTMGPMSAAADFAGRVSGQAARIEVSLFGSLALTGKGHATDRAIMLGLAGHLPADIDPDAADAEVAGIRATGWLRLAGSMRSSSTRRATCSSASASGWTSIPMR